MEIGDKIGNLTLLEIQDDLGHDLYIFECLCGNYLTLYEHELDKEDCGKCNRVPHHRVKGRPELGTEEYKQWRKKVFAKANFKCEICGSKYKLAAHHKNAWNWAIHERYLVDNGACLCKMHHDDLHRLFGFNTTEEQYRQYKVIYGIIN